MTSEVLRKPWTAGIPPLIYLHDFDQVTCSALNLSYFICKMGIKIIIPFLKDSCEIRQALTIYLDYLSQLLQSDGLSTGCEEKFLMMDFLYYLNQVSARENLLFLPMIISVYESRNFIFFLF